MISPALMSCTTFCIVCFINLGSAECVCSYYGLRVCYKQINSIKIKLFSYYLINQFGKQMPSTSECQYFFALFSCFTTRTLFPVRKALSGAMCDTPQTSIQTFLSEATPTFLCRYLVMLSFDITLDRFAIISQLCRRQKLGTMHDLR